MRRQPILPKPRTPRGKVHILRERCKGCGFCIEFCPTNVLDFSSDFNTKGYHPPMVVNSSECVNCNLCYMVCPEFAIYSTLVTEVELESEARARKKAKDVAVAQDVATVASIATWKDER